MKLNELKPGQKKVARKRKGQGNATGQGTFGGRGMNGQNSRAGGGVRAGFEGGQTPLVQRMPKNPGFNNPNRVVAQVVSLDALEGAYKDGEKVTVESLLKKGVISKNNSKVKILGDGKITKKVEVTEEILVSGSAKKAIEKAGGTVAEVKKEEPKKEPKKEVKKKKK